METLKIQRSISIFKRGKISKLPLNYHPNVSYKHINFTVFQLDTKLPNIYKLGLSTSVKLLRENDEMAPNSLIWTIK